MKKRIWKWVGFVSLVLLVSAAVWSYYYIYRPSKLLEAMMNGDKAEVTRLIDEEGYDPNVRYFNRVPAFDLYTLSPGSNPDLNMVEFLFSKGFGTKTYGKLSPMLTLTLLNNVELMKIFVKNGYDSKEGIRTTKNHCYVTPLDLAVALNNDKMISFLLERGGVISCYANKDFVLKNALLCIQQKKCPEILRNKFLEAGTKPELMKEIEAEIKKDSK